MMTQSRSSSFDQEKLRLLCEEVDGRYEELCDLLHIEYSSSHRRITGTCPIHMGDNPTAFSLDYNGRWKCYTHHCENTFHGSVIGLIRGVLSQREYGWEKHGDKTTGFFDALSWLENFVQKKYSDIKVNSREVEKKRFSKRINSITNTTQSNSINISREFVRSKLQIPAPYYIRRGYDAKILDKYDVGLCNDSTKEMKHRVVVPIYDVNGEFVGCTGRSTAEKCEKCQLYHHTPTCPSIDYKYHHLKWIHSKDFKSTENLYNLNNAKSYIIESSTIIVVESPGNVWRLEENGIHNSVATFGATISYAQKMLIDSTGALSIIVVGDNDDGGRELIRKVKSLCGKTYRIYTACPKVKNDLGDMLRDEITQEIKPIIEQAQSLFCSTK